MRNAILVLLLTTLAACASQAPPQPATKPAAPAGPVTRTATSADGLQVSYTVQGAGPVALLFIHGGYVDSSVWRNQVGAFSGQYRVITLDLGGHGASGKERTAWTTGALAGDVVAVAEAEKLARVVLIGSSMGGPIALEAAARLPGRAIAVIGVDTLQDVGKKPDETQWKARLDAFRDHFDQVCPAMAKAMFHPDADGALVQALTTQMCAFPAPLAATLLDAFTGYDMGAVMRAAKVPVRSVNGDLYPTNVAGNRAFEPTYDATILPGVGHYPMLEKPAEFNQALAQMLQGLVAR
jgi:pimeloyl-ACP methyl ester carboxylesterase